MIDKKTHLDINQSIKPGINPTIILSFLYSKIKERTKGPFIKTKLLKEIIQTHFICVKGPNEDWRKGINRIYIYDIIDDMINFNLIKRIDHGKYEILPIEEQNLVIKSLKKKIKYLKKLERKKEVISEHNLNKLNEELNKVIKLIDNNSEFKILKSDCKKKLRKFPY